MLAFLQGNGTFAYDFRSFEGVSADDDGDGQPDDPFSNPDGGPLVRIEQKLDKLEEKLMAEEGGGLAFAKSSTSSREPRFSKETIVTAVVPLEMGSSPTISPTGERMKEEVIE